MHHQRQQWGGVESPLAPTISVNVDDFETDEYIDDDNAGGQGTTNASSFFPAGVGGGAFDQRNHQQSHQRRREEKPTSPSRINFYSPSIPIGGGGGGGFSSSSPPSAAAHPVGGAQIWGGGGEKATSPPSPLGMMGMMDTTNTIDNNATMMRSSMTSLTTPTTTTTMSNNNNNNNQQQQQRVQLHSNLYIKNLPERVDELQLNAIFSLHGRVESCCVIRDATTQVSRGFGFVKFQTFADAVNAIANMNGKVMHKKAIEVKFANSDSSGTSVNGSNPQFSKQNVFGVAPPTANINIASASTAQQPVVSLENFGSPDQANSVVNNLLSTTANNAANSSIVFEAIAQQQQQLMQQIEMKPSDNIYVKGLPPIMAENDLMRLFSKFGNVIECRLLHASMTTSVGALIRFETVDMATLAVNTTNGITLVGATTPLTVRFADSSSKNRRRQNNNATTNNTNNGNNDKSVRNGNQYKPNVENKNNKKSNRYPSTSSPKRGGSKHNNTSYLSTMSSDEINHAGFLADEAASDLSFSSGEDFAVAAEFRLKLNNLPTLCNDLLLYTTFAPYGAIKWVKTALDDDGRCSSGNAWVAFRRRKDAENASANLRNTKLGERIVQIERTYNSV